MLFSESCKLLGKTHIATCLIFGCVLVPDCASAVLFISLFASPLCFWDEV